MLKKHKSPCCLDFPLLGPHFVPLSPGLLSKRSAKAVTPENYYLKPLTVVHHCYDNLAKFGCPGCRKRGTSADVKWQQWNATGPRKVHGLESVEYAIGLQMMCNTCKQASSAVKQHHFWTTTSREFWDGIPYWQIPSMFPYIFLSIRIIKIYLEVTIPQFLHRCALTRLLFDMITEQRISIPSATLSEHIRRESHLHRYSVIAHSTLEMHLLMYHRRRYEYLSLNASSKHDPAQAKLQFHFKAHITSDFSAPDDASGYNDEVVSDDIISEVYIQWVSTSRREESERLCRSISGLFSIVLAYFC
jgi:hypothetical protein